MIIRDSRIDLLRVISTFVVVLTHVTYFLFINNQPFSWDTNFLFSYLRWTTPVFVMIAGCLNIPKSRELESFEFIKRKLAKLILPLLVWTIIHIAIYYLYFGGSIGKMLLVGPIRGTAPGGLWFLYMIAGMYTFTPIIAHVVNRLDKSELKLVTAFLLVIPSLDSLVGGVSYGNLFLFKFIPFIGYYLLGYLIGNSLIEIRLPTQLIVIGFILCGVLAALVSEFMHYIGYDQYRFFMHTRFSPPAMLMSIAIFIIGLRAEVPNIVCKVATYMPEVYLVHTIIIYALKDVVAQQSSSWNLLEIILIWFGVSTLSVIASYFIHHIKILKFLRL